MSRVATIALLIALTMTSAPALAQDGPEFSTPSECVRVAESMARLVIHLGGVDPNGVPLSVSFSSGHWQVLTRLPLANDVEINIDTGDVCRFMGTPIYREWNGHWHIEPVPVPGGLPTRSGFAWQNQPVNWELAWRYYGESHTCYLRGRIGNLWFHISTTCSIN